MTATRSRTLEPQQFQRLAKVIYDRSGISFNESKRYVLESRLSRRLDELDLDNYDQYLMLLSTGPYQNDEFQELFNRVTINETSFFRNEPQLEYFETRILPRLIEARKSVRRLRIWSAACSSGEEPYTLAIQLHRSLGVRLADWNIEILGTDISERVLDQAAGGRYPSYSVRNLSPVVLKRYFKEVSGFFQIDPAIQTMVHFEKLNLKDAFAARRFGTFDVIFCRNVMIYFDDAMKASVIRMFHNQLAPDGTLFIGHSESLRNLDVGFEQVAEPYAFAYNRVSE